MGQIYQRAHSLRRPKTEEKGTALNKQWQIGLFSFLTRPSEREGKIMVSQGPINSYGTNSRVHSENK